ncbi:gliding motility-associated C-terminal domain-containing protein, partial [Cecembia sp.]|uniref:T9SS type B sorting domain-containing protein n=1 Tax=Cecembia sp. TaxID=1898110 RepID=UPI0025B899F8
GDPVDPADVTITPNTEGPLTVNADGTVTVAPNTPAGIYTVDYTVCEILNPGNCNSATVTIELVEGNLIANDIDFGTFTTDYDGLLGNALANDLLNGQELDPNLVDFDVTDFGGLEGVFVNPNGDLFILPFLNTPGVYVLTYRICEILNPENCRTASITVEIEESRVDLVISKSSQDVEIFEGDEFDYIIELVNNSDVTAFNVVITDDLPSGVSYVTTNILENPQDLSVAVRTGQGQVIYEIPEMPGRATITIRLRVRANPLSGQDQVTIRNVIAVLADQVELVPEDNNDEDVNIVNGFFIPNVITPNNDGRNDFFVVKGLNKFVSNKIVIFNRWGDHVFESDNYQNNWNAEGLIDGTYFYVLTAIDNEGREHQFKGWIHVTRTTFD